MADTAVTLTLRTAPERRVEAECIAPDRFATLAEGEIARLPIWDGPRQIPLGELFDVRGGRAATVRVAGDLAPFDAIGAGMTAGELVVDGNVGRYVGTRMAGGTLRVTGNAGDGAGLEMAGGLLDIGGDAGHRAGAARMGSSKGMLGGELVVRGSAGDGAGTRMRRGLVVVCGRAGAHTGAGMIAGSVIVLGDLGADPGRGNKRGSIVTLGAVTIPVTYRYACTYRPPHLALTLRNVRARHGVRVEDRWLTETYRRYSGDLAELGKGELLTWTPQ